MISYRGDEATGCVGWQSGVEPGLGSSDYLKPNRFFGTERKRFSRVLLRQGSFVLEKNVDGFVAGSGSVVERDN